MTPVGHAAFAYLAATPRTMDVRAPIWVILGAFIPDILDKMIMALGILPWGRTVGHSAFVWFAIVCLVELWNLEARSVPRARWMAWGAVSHLACDLVDDFSAGFESSGYAFSTWFGFPWTNADMFDWKVHPAFPPERAVSALELCCYGLCAAYVWWRHQKSSILIPP